MADQVNNLTIIGEIEMLPKGFKSIKTSLYLDKSNSYRLHLLDKKGIKLDINGICNNAIKERLDKLEKENPALFK